MDRYNLTGLKGYKIVGFQRYEHRPEFIEILLMKPAGKIRRKIQVRYDQVFDVNGNHFNTDNIE